MGIGIQTGLTDAQLLESQLRAHELVGQDLVTQDEIVPDGLTSTQAKDAIYKAHSISSSASEIDDTVHSWSLIKQSSSFSTLQEALDSMQNGETLDINKDYTSNDGFTLNANNVRIYTSNNSEISSTAIDSIVLNLIGNKNECLGLTINGNNVAKTGIQITSSIGTRIQGNIIYNVKATTSSSNGIVTATNSYGFTIDNNIIYNISSVTSGINGEEVGASTGILILCQSDRTIKSLVRANAITNITGREGVGIYTSSTLNTTKSNTDLIGNTIHNITRRAIKVQGSSNCIEMNTYTNDLLFTSLTNLRAGIEIFGQNNSVNNNVLNTIYTSGIIVSANSEGSKITKNTILCTNSSYTGWAEQEPRGILNLSNDIEISGNCITGGYASIELTNAARTKVSGNSLTAYATTGVGIRVSGASGNSKIFDTTLLSNSSGIGFFIGVRIDAPNISVKKVDVNYIGCESFNNNTIRFYSGADTAILEDINGIGINTTIKDGTSKTRVSNISHATNTTGIGAKIYFASENPSTALSTNKYNRGDICFNTLSLSGGAVGWVCTAAGVPGTWKIFGTIEV